MSGLFRVRPGSIREVGDEAAGRGSERDYKSCPQGTDCVRTVHVLKEIIKAVLHALAKLRKELQARLPKRSRGRPKKAQTKDTRRVQHQERRIKDLFEHRHLFVRRKLTAAKGRTLWRITQ